MRAGCALALVLTLTAVAGWLGPQLSGLLAPFPIIATVLATFTHAQRGPHEAQRLLRWLLGGYGAFALFCFTLAVSLPPSRHRRRLRAGHRSGAADPGQRSSRCSPAAPTFAPPRSRRRCRRAAAAERGRPGEPLQVGWPSRASWWRMRSRISAKRSAS